MSIAAGCIMSLACISCCRSFLGATALKDYPRAFWFKGAAGLCFVALGLLGASRCGASTYGWKLAAGLFMGLLGDQLLALRFIRTERFDLLFTAGALSFALGHGLYIWAMLERFSGCLPLGLALAAVFIAGSVFTLKRQGFKAGKLAPGAYAYIAVVCLMGAVAVSAAIGSGTAAAVLLALGGLCFIVSDDTLCVYSFGNDKRFGLNILLHGTYYAAQLLIGWSLFVI